MEEALTQACIDLVCEAMRDRNTKAGYKRVLKAFDAIGLNEQGRGKVLYHLNYADNNGKPYQWLFAKKAVMRYGSHSYTTVKEKS